MTRSDCGRNAPSVPIAALGVLLLFVGCGRAPEAGPDFALSFVDAGPACASGTCGLQAAESSPVQMPTAVTLDARAVGRARLRGDRQRVATRLTDRGFRPAVIVLQRGVPAEIRIHRPAQREGLRLNVPVYAEAFPLARELTVLEVVPDFDFTAGLDGRSERFYVRVLEDVRGQSRKAVAATVASYLELIRDFSP